MEENVDPHESSAGRRRLLGAIGTGSLAGLLAGCGEGTDRPTATATRNRGTERPDPTGTPGETSAQTDSTPATDREDGGPFGEYDVIDGHVHLVARDAYGRETMTADEMVSWMDRNGVDRAVLLPLESPTSFEVLSPTWWNVDQAAKYPDRLIPFGVVDPRIIVWGRDLLERRIAAWVDEGARGFGEFKVNLPVDEERMRIVYEICETHDLPIVVHMDDVRATDEVGLPGLESVLQAHPRVDFIMHGPGWWANIDGDATQDDMGRYPDGPVGSPGAVERLLTDYDNVYASIDSGSGWNALSRDPEYAQTLLESHHEQIVYGTDKIYAGQDIGQFSLPATFELSDEAWRNVLSRNLEGLLIDPPE